MKSRRCKPVAEPAAQSLQEPVQGPVEVIGEGEQEPAGRQERLQSSDEKDNEFFEQLQAFNARSQVVSPKPTSSQEDAPITLDPERRDALLQKAREDREAFVEGTDALQSAGVM